MAERPAPRFGEVLRELRTGAGLTQERLADRARLSARTISDLERGIAQSPHGDTTDRLAAGLGLDETTRAWFSAAAQGRRVAAPGAADPAAGGAAAVATRTLPRDIASFTGRDGEIRELAARVADAGVYVIGGMAGIGKTTFAVHAAHELAGRFPDGQLYLPLHGHTPGQRPVAPADALASLLVTAGVDTGQVPPDLAGRERLWRDRLAGRRLLLVLDDAAGSEQVRPLLPGTGECLVLITSRRRLTALDDARAVSLDVLPPAQAADLVIRLAARPALDPADPAIRELAALCGYLPLALGMLARRLHHRPAWTPADLVAELAAARSRVELMHAEDWSVAAAFSLSYRDLTPAQQQLFRHLGLHPGAEIDALAAAALGGGNPADAGHHLEALYDQHLITEPARGRYRLHDLIRDYAADLAAAADPTESGPALSRLLDYFEHTATLATSILARYPRPGPAARPGPAPPAAPSLASRDEALTWLRTERAGLLACIVHAAAHEQPRRVAALTVGLSALLRLDGPWAQAVDLHAAAADAARQAGDELAEAAALLELALMRNRTADYARSIADMRRAAARYADLGSQLGEASALAELGAMQQLGGHFRQAAADLERSLELYRALGNRQGEAGVLSEIGAMRWVRGDRPGASQVIEDSVELTRDLGDGQSEAKALQQQAMVVALGGDARGALTLLRRAIRLDSELGNALGEASSLHLLGVVLRVMGEFGEARAALERGLAMFTALGLRFGEVSARHELGVLQRLSGDPAGAAVVHRQVLADYISLRHRAGEGIARNELGVELMIAGDYRGAERELRQALDIVRETGVADGEAEVLNNMGELALLTGDREEALARHRRALDLARSAGGPVEEARSLEGIGRCARAAGDAAAAAASLRMARQLYWRAGAEFHAAKLDAELGQS